MAHHQYEPHSCDNCSGFEDVKLVYSGGEMMLSGQRTDPLWLCAKCREVCPVCEEYKDECVCGREP
jgi:hypothetical protein